jgi:hypothetical protein
MAAAVAVLVSNSGAASDASSGTCSAAGRLLLMPAPSAVIMVVLLQCVAYGYAIGKIALWTPPCDALPVTQWHCRAVTTALLPAQQDSRFRTGLTEAVMV